MDNWAFGITMTVVGVGGTFLTLWILSLVMSFLSKLFPVSAEPDKTQKNP
jgi:Na+-transporting methylmalonyl-CoA/oxaloacetate decarboxylase gamma subunit